MHAYRENLSDVCLPYQRLQIVGTTLIDPTPLTTLPYGCLNENRLNQLSRDLTQAYLNAGHVYNPFPVLKKQEERGNELVSYDKY